MLERKMARNLYEGTINTTYIKKEALSRVHRRGVESITPVGSAAGWTTGSFAVVDAKIVCDYVYA